MHEDEFLISNLVSLLYLFSNGSEIFSKIIGFLKDLKKFYNCKKFYEELTRREGEGIEYSKYWNLNHKIENCNKFLETQAVQHRMIKR